VVLPGPSGDRRQDHNHELSAKYAALARENFKKAGVEDLVTLVEGDAHETVTRLKTD